MHTTNRPQRVLSLCTGYGGIELGLEQCGLSVRPVAYVEIEAFSIRNLVAKVEEGAMAWAPVFTDLKSFPYGRFSGLVDGIIGGYPCQPFSAAGKRLGKDDPRHLWPWIADGIKLCRPRWVFFENVEGHISKGLREVLDELGGLGYQHEAGLFSAAEVGAPHQRKRVFILAHRVDAGLEGLAGHGDGIDGQEWETPQPDGPVGTGGLQRWPSRPGEEQYDWEPPRVC